MNNSISPGTVGLINHRLVRQLRFTRGELIHCLDGVDDHKARKRFKPMNSISWIIGHLAEQENLFWVRMAQGIMLALCCCEIFIIIGFISEKHMQSGSY